MFNNARSWRVVAAVAAVGVAGLVGISGTAASAEPGLPADPVPAPVTVTQTVTVAPTAAPVATANTVTPGPAPGPEVPTTVVASPATSTPATAPTPTLVPAGSGTLTDYFRDKGVTVEPQNPRDFRALSITLPMPTGWTQVPDPNVPDAFAVIADRAGGDGLYTSNAQLVVYKLVGEFDPREAITHGYVDSQKQPNWQTTDASLAEFGGFPSSIIEGTYLQNDMLLNTSRRHVIATVGPDRYLITLSVSTAANRAVAAANATDAIVNGFRVADPAAAVATTPVAPAPAPALPAAPPPAS